MLYIINPYRRLSLKIISSYLYQKYFSIILILFNTIIYEPKTIIFYSNTHQSKQTLSENTACCNFVDRQEVQEEPNELQHKQLLSVQSKSCRFLTEKYKSIPMECDVKFLLLLQTIITHNLNKTKKIHFKPLFPFFFLFQDVAIHSNQLRLRQTPSRHLYRLRHFRPRHAQHSPLLLRRFLHLPLRIEHPFPALRFLLPAARELLLHRHREATETRRSE